MNKLIFIFLIVVLSFVSCKKGTELKNDTDKNVELINKEPQFQYYKKDIVYDKIFNSNEVDFKNLEYYLFQNNDKFSLKNGKFFQEYDGGITEISINSINDLNGYKIIDLNTFFAGGSSSTNCIVQIFKINENKLYLLYEVVYYQKGDAEFVLNKNENYFIIRSNAWAEGEPNCCPSLIDTGKFTIDDEGSLKLLSWEIIKK